MEGEIENTNGKTELNKFRIIHPNDKYGNDKTVTTNSSQAEIGRTEETGNMKTKNNFVCKLRVKKAH